MNNYNMSEYQKIIFVKGLDEQDQNLTVLSNNYPFVMFISNGQTYYDNKPIRNIWIDGVRLTRFVGVDNNRNSIKIGDHTLKLNFDYETGLLSIIDDVKLIKLKLISYSYIPVNSNTLTTVTYVDNIPINIFAKDNKFSLIFEYQYETDNDEADLISISKSLSYNSNNFTKISNNIYLQPGNNIIQYQFTYKITDALFNNSNVNFISQYSNDKQVNAEMVLYLNPTEYTINIGNINVNNNDIIKLEKNKQYNINLYFSPQVSSTAQLKLKARMNILDNNHVLSNSSNYYECTIYNGIATFTINTVEELPNINNVNAYLSFDIYYEKNNEESTYNNLNKVITLSFDTEVTEAFFYFGYQNESLMNIESDSFITYAEGLIHNYSNRDLGNYIFETNYNEYEDSNNYLYCIIPQAYDGENGVKPRFKGKYHNRTYVPVLNTWFVKLGTKTLNNVECNIYKRKLRGEFFGLIK